MKSLLVLQICLVFVSLANAQTIPKSIDDPVKKKVVKPVKRGKPEEVVKKKETLSPSFFAGFTKILTEFQLKLIAPTGAS